MKIGVITDRRKGFSPPVPQCDILLFGGGQLGTVDYASELSGKSDKLENMANFSHLAECGVLCGCVTDSRGLKRKSVAVASEGKLLGISDMLYVLDGEEYKSGATLGVYSVGGYKVGVCIENDLRFPECINALSLYGCNIVAVFCEDMSDGIAPLLIRSYAYLYGIPFVMAGNGVAYFADITGGIASSNNDIALFEAPIKNCYRVVTARRKGIFCGSVPDF